MVDDGQGQKSPRWQRWLRAVVLFLLAAAFFYAAVALLRQTTLVFKPDLEAFLASAVSGELEALGASWVSAYVALNGSVIAATGLAFFEAGLISPSQLALVIFGSRLGAAGIVVLVGLLDYFRHQRDGLRGSTSLGVLVFVVTCYVTIPAALLGWAWVSLDGLGIVGNLSVPESLGHDAGMLDTLLARFVESIGPVLSLVSAIGLLMVSLEIFDRVIRSVDQESLRERLRPWFRGRWRPFAVGLILTVLTTSVAFSLGAIVPLYNRGFLRREEMIPYVLGANIGTFGDTIIVALLLERAGGVSITLLVLACIFVCTVIVLSVYPPFERAAVRSVDIVTKSRATLGIFLFGLALIPLGLLGLGFLV